MEKESSVIPPLFVFLAAGHAFRCAAIESLPDCCVPAVRNLVMSKSEKVSALLLLMYQILRLVIQYGGVTGVVLETGSEVRV